MNLIDSIGTLAGFLTTISFIPQVVKTWRSGSAEDISLFMFVLFSGGVLLWLVYGIAIESLPIILANSITLLLSTSILYMKLRYLWLQHQREKLAAHRCL